MVHDAAEQHDLGTDHVLARRLEGALQGYLQAGLQLAARRAVGQDRDSLRALGYVE